MVCRVSLLNRSVMIDASRRLRHVKRKEKAKLFKVSYSDLSKTVRLFLAGRDPTITPKKIVKELDRTLQAVRNGRVFSRILNHHSFLHFIYRAAWLQSLYDKTGKIEYAYGQNTDEWYEYFDDFAFLLNHPKSLVRNRFLYILAANAQWDDENRFDAIFDDYLRMSQMKNR